MSGHHQIVLRFSSEEQKDEFLGQFLDGWGEGLPIQTRQAVDGSWDVIDVEVDDPDLEDDLGYQP